MALVDLKSNLASFRANFVTPSIEAQASVNTYSALDINDIPTAYSKETQFKPKLINSSKLNLDTTPTKFSASGKYKPSRLNILKVVNSSKLNIDNNPTKFSPNTIYGPSKFTNIKAVNASKFNLDVTPTKFNIELYKPSELAKYQYGKVLSTRNSKFDSGDATVANPIGKNGSLFNYIKNGGITTKLFSKGWTSSSRYIDTVKSNSILLNKATVQNSPSAIDAEYKKFNLRDDAYNPTYIRHPLIVRGIQRKGNEKPQYWGFGSKSGFDDGLIRGGVVTVADRIVADTARIAKWMASPKGLLWVVKQVGLGLTNAKVEAVGGILGRQTRIHTGVTTLLSVPGSALGLHFTRHGLPFLNETASYEFVSKIKNSLDNYNPILDTGTANPIGNRLIALHKEYATELKYSNKILSSLQKVKFLKTKGLGSVILSGLGGSASVYGIGFTQMRRYVNTVEDAKERAVMSGDFQVKFNSLYFSYTQPYYNGIGKNSSKVITDIDAPGLNKDKLSLGNMARLINKNPNDKTVTLLLRGLALKEKDGKPIESTKINNPYNPVQPAVGDDDAKRLIINNNPAKPTYYVGTERANTGKPLDTPASTNVNRLTDSVKKYENDSLLSLQNTYNNLTDTNKNETEVAIANNTVKTPNPFNSGLSDNTTKDTTYVPSDIIGATVNNYITMAYGDIPNRKGSGAISTKYPNDFRNAFSTTGNQTQLRLAGTTISNYYQNYNREKRYGFNTVKTNAELDSDEQYSRGPKSFLVAGQKFTKASAANQLSKSQKMFRGDKVTAYDIRMDTTMNTPAKVYEDIGSKDFIKFYFEDGDKKNQMVFRATITGFTDSFSPGWNQISIMGRPDGAYMYSSFERSVSFTFMVAATSRSEMIPMWRKLNFLSSYTQPEFGGGKPSGPIMRITIGDLFCQTPAFISSLSYSIPDEATWDIADDYADTDDTDKYLSADAKQLPMAVEVSITFTMIMDYRPQNMGRNYSLSHGGAAASAPGQWLTGAVI